jgi:hypothetical protein
MLYAILGGIIAATIPFYCSAVLLIVLHPTPTKEFTPSVATAVIPSRQIPLPATNTPPGQSQLTFTPTNTAFIPPTPTITPTSTKTSQPTPPPPPTHTHTPIPTDTPPPTNTPTEIPSDTPVTP